MQFSLDSNTSTYQIRAYSPGKIKINDQEISHSLVIMSEHLLSPWEPASLRELKIEHVITIIENYHPDIILLGTGPSLIFPAADFIHYFAQHRIALEIMDTGAACRTYNVLSAEGRIVAAALLNSQ